MKATQKKSVFEITTWKHKWISSFSQYSLTLSKNGLLKLHFFRISLKFSKALFKRNNFERLVLTFAHWKQVRPWFLPIICFPSNKLYHHPYTDHWKGQRTKDDVNVKLVRLVLLTFYAWCPSKDHTYLEKPANISYPLIHTCTWAYQGLINVSSVCLNMF